MIKRYDPELERDPYESCDDEATMMEIKGGHYVYAQDLHYELRQLLAECKYTPEALPLAIELLLEELK